MSIFRSERMSFCRLILHQDYAFDCLVELGYVGKVQFVHIDPDDEHVANNKFASEIQRCVEVLRLMRNLQDEINKIGMHTVYYEDADEQKPKQNELPEIERAVQQLDTELNDVQSQCDGLQKRRFVLYEQQQVIEKCDEFLKMGQISVTLFESSASEELGLFSNELRSPLFIITGSIPVERFAAFEVMVWRVSRGKSYINHAEFELPEEMAARFNEHTFKYAFIVAVVGEQLHQKISKVCSGFQTQIYECAHHSSAERLKELQGIKANLYLLNEIFWKSCKHKKRVLAVASGDLFQWRATIKKMHQVYYLMNQLGTFHESRHQFSKYLKAECWIPNSDMPVVRAALIRGSRVAAGGMSTLTFPPLLVPRKRPADLKVPTYFRTNKFTNGFQSLVDAYGMPSYRELNPAPYTIVTFPFLFAVMFGDIGHGILMTLFALGLIWYEKKIERKRKLALKSSEVFDLLYAGRYILLLMGVFSIYTGLIYNDMLSKTLNIYGSSWHVNLTKVEIKPKTKFIRLDPSNTAHFRGAPYLLGIDPVWASFAENSITLNNSLKMKVAIILGVIQMIFGLTLSAGNALFFRSKVDLYLVFLPQLVFFVCLFLYLVLMIFFKWAMFGGHQEGVYSAACAPSILITFINMILMKSAEAPPQGCHPTMFEGQLTLQRFLLAVALLAVPILLLGRPLYLTYQHRRIQTISDPDYQAEFKRSTMHSLRKSLIYNIKFTESDPNIQRHDAEEQLSEVWIHQGIHTIECVLGSVSHTASYLRLWALSLAHSQLSGVLWDMVLRHGLSKNLGYYNSIVIFVAFGAFAVLTLAILVVMEGLSAFLHTLRLHWVEFQSKFYGGLGEAFAPFRFEASRRRDSYT